jgi:hypothetical protein
MTTATPSPGTDPGLSELHTLAMHLCGLLEAMASQTHHLPPRGLPLDSLIFAARPLAQKLADGLEAHA